MQALVIDTNIVLDLWVFQDPSVAELREALQCGQWRWLASAAMREELVRVLAYEHINQRVQRHGLCARDVLAQFDAQVCLVDSGPKAGITCKDPDDQKFIDLAVTYRAGLLSKDKALLALKRRLQALGIALNPELKTP